MMKIVYEQLAKSGSHVNGAGKVYHMIYTYDLYVSTCSVRYEEFYYLISQVY